MNDGYYDSSKDAAWLENEVNASNYMEQWVCLSEGVVIDSDRDVKLLRERISQMNLQKRYVVTNVHNILFWERVNKSYEAMKNDPEIWNKELEERKFWGI